MFWSDEEPQKAEPVDESTVKTNDVELTEMEGKEDAPDGEKSSKSSEPQDAWGDMLHHAEDDAHYVPRPYQPHNPDNKGDHAIHDLNRIGKELEAHVDPNTNFAERMKGKLESKEGLLKQDYNDAAQ